MSFGKRAGIVVQVVLDWSSALIAWLIFFVLRKLLVDHYQTDLQTILADKNLLYGLIIIPLAWVLFYFISGTYTDIYRKSRLNELLRSFIQTVIGATAIFFILILDDQVPDYQSYYLSFTILLSVHFTVLVISRMGLLSYAKHRVSKGLHSFRTIMIGGKNKALDVYNNYHGTPHLFGQKVIGFIGVNGNTETELKSHIPYLGHLNDVDEILNRYQIDDIIIAIESSDHSEVSRIINELSGRDLFIKILPDLYDILAGRVRMDQITGAPLIEIFPETMAKWQRIIKRILDLVISFFALFLLSPLFIFIALRVKLSSKGPIFYQQERIGWKGEPFTIYKFRSMYPGAEESGPALSSENDPRITPWGTVMRKWRLDELPQFWNVLKGDMTLIGPRPERKFYIDQMAKIAPHCRHLQRVRPGLTSLGMVRYGYAENVEQMIERLHYDIIYIENRSLSLDFKIFIYTINTLLKGRGK